MLSGWDCVKEGSAARLGGALSWRHKTLLPPHPCPVLAAQEIVALSGAHTLGRAHANRSGFGASSASVIHANALQAPPWTCKQ